MLFVGIDIGKTSCVAAFLSTDLLARYHRYESCPTLNFPQTRTGFEKLLATIARYGAVSDCHLLLELTGHYGRALEQYVLEQGLSVYQVHVQKRETRDKSDKRDAQGLAAMLYNQIERHILLAEKSQTIRRLIVPNATERLLQGLVQHRSELTRETVRHKNKLTAIADELFPELTQVFRDPNSITALKYREAFPTPQKIATVEMDALYALRKRNHPGNVALANLHQLARQSIGTKDESRLKSLTIEQHQLIAELRLLKEHEEALNIEIKQAVQASREGQILTSFKVIGSVQAGMLIAGIGSIANFESAAKLRAYCGWAPRQDQTGTSYDTVVLAKGGNRLLRHTVYLITLNAVRLDTPFRALYRRLLPLKCTYDERLKRYTGQMKVIGRIAGQLITVIYTLLKRDYDVLARLPVGQKPPAPELYDPTKHRIRRK